MKPTVEAARCMSRQPDASKLNLFMCALIMARHFIGHVKTNRIT
jgi:hypothetical protein